MLETSEIPETMPDPDDDVEGCLSVPGEQFPTGRAEWAKVTGTDADGNPVEIEGTASSPACSSTRSATSTASSTSTC